MILDEVYDVLNTSGSIAVENKVYLNKSIVLSSHPNPEFDQSSEDEALNTTLSMDSINELTEELKMKKYMLAVIKNNCSKFIYFLMKKGWLTDEKKQSEEHLNEIKEYALSIRDDYPICYRCLQSIFSFPNLQTFTNTISEVPGFCQNHE